MLKIELTRFEVEDIITASIIEAPNETTESTESTEATSPACQCNHGPTAPGHIVWEGAKFQSNYHDCPAWDGHHDKCN